MTGFWPEISVRSSTAFSSSDGCCVARPTPMLITTFSSFGICMSLLMPRSLASCCLIVLLYRAFSRGCVAGVMSDLLTLRTGDADLVALLVDRVAEPHGLALVHEHHVRGVDRHVLVDDPALLVGAARPLVLGGDVDAADDDLVLGRNDALYDAFLALVLAGDHAD